MLAPALVCSERLKWKWSAALFVPFIFPYLFYAVFNSMRVTLKQRGISWRETFYSLEELKKHGVR
ncbi:MAG: hypothetical protein JWM04_1029 [Verrucomicrobiales bacterium]|nr:hypothetical protein [Verrucomicrobiales bacterium]